MWDYETYRTEHGCQVLRQYRRKAGTQIDLLRRPDGSTFICRIYDHPVPAYEKLLGHSCDALPKIYCAMDTPDGGTLVEEEFVDGLPLSQLLVSCRLETPQVCAIVRAVCEALAVLHENDLIHRDVKPENILLTSAGRVVLLDLDAAGRQSSAGDRDTKLLGTVGYAAPEQFGFGRSDVRTDIFSLGILMNVLLTRNHPSQVLAEGRLRPVIETCVQMNADKRYSSVQELLRQLPRSEKGQECPICGFHSPGGGCIYCGMTLDKRRPEWRWLVGLGLVLCAIVLAFGCRFKKAEPQVQKIETEHAEPLRAQEQPVQAAEAELLTAGRPVTEADFYSEEQPLEQAGVFSLEDGRTYYASVSMAYLPVYTTNHSVEQELELGDYRNIPFQLFFWTGREDGTCELVTEPQLLRQIGDAFQGSLRLELWPLRDHAAAELPAIYTDPKAEPWQKSLSLLLGHEHAGHWQLKAVGEINGQSVEAGTRLVWNPLRPVRWEPDLMLDIPVVEQINEYLGQVGIMERTVLHLHLPAGEFSGQIQIPDRLGTMSVTLSGTVDETGTPLTVLRGGVESQITNGLICDIHFQGAGMDRPRWEDGSPNMGLFGTGGSCFLNCIFEQYDCGVHNTDRIKVGSASVFRDNRVGVYVDNRVGHGGNPSWNDNRYENNETAIHFAAVDGHTPMDFWDHSGSVFSDNEIDVKNDLEREAYLNGCAFYRDGIEGSCAAQPEGSVITK